MQRQKIQRFVRVQSQSARTGFGAGCKGTAREAAGSFNHMAFYAFQSYELPGFGAHARFPVSSARVKVS